MQDLLELGFADFVRQPRIRTSSAHGCWRSSQRCHAQAHCANRMDRRLPAGTLQRTEYRRIYGLAHRKGRFSRNGRPHGVARPSLASAMQAARHNTARVWAQRPHDRTGILSSCEVAGGRKFEREYIANALAATEGNIAMAARASSKHRRAFWGVNAQTCHRCCSVQNRRRRGLKSSPYQPVVHFPPPVLRSGRKRQGFTINQGTYVSSAAIPENSVFLRALLREPVPYTPVWLMRQAGVTCPNTTRRARAGSFLGLAVA